MSIGGLPHRTKSSWGNQHSVQLSRRVEDISRYQRSFAGVLCLPALSDSYGKVNSTNQATAFHYDNVCCCSLI